MNLPYIALLWNPLDPKELLDAVHVLQRLRDLNWHETLLRSGLAVYTLESPVPYLRADILHSAKGVILGVLFERRHNRRVSQEEISGDSKFADACLTSNGRHLVQNYWGGYVAILSDAHNGDWHVIRDCSGMVPCYYTRIRSVTIVTSDARGILAVECLTNFSHGESSFEINWKYLAAFIANSQLQIRESALRSVYELLAGESLHGTTGRQRVEVAWSPGDYAIAESWESIDDCAVALHETVRSCIDAWAALHEWIIHSLSGGFDSSLVLSLLSRRRRRPNVVCVNRFALGPAEDERRYARIAAKAAHATLIEWPWSFGESRLSTESIRRPMALKPSIPALLASLEAPFYRALRTAHRFDAIWTGEGGDHLFLAFKTALAVADFLYLRGPRREFLATLRDVSRVTGWSIPHLAVDGVLRWLHCAPTRQSSNADHSLLLGTSQYRHDLDSYIAHPWYGITDQLPPGKRYQIQLLADVLHRQRPLSDTQKAVELHPLLSQPIIERCLRIPTYTLLYGGHTRGLARKTFSGDLPPEILWRELKGQTTHNALGLFHRSKPFIAKLLISGFLVRQGILDPMAVRTLLRTGTSLRASEVFPLFAAVSAEAWVRSRVDPNGFPSGEELSAA